MSSCDRSASRIVSAFLAATIAAVVTASGTAQAPQWFATNPHPHARTGACVATMPFSGRPVILSGEQPRSLFARLTYEADLWEWSGSRWSRIDAAGPPSRRGGAMSLDLQRQRIVLFGGWNPQSGWLNDTWEFDGVGWIQRTPPLSPPAPDFSLVLAYHPLRQRTVLFGGFGASAANPVNGTWEWDGSSWLQRSVPQPSLRWSTAMVFDFGRGKMLLYGGIGSSNVLLGDTWTYDGSWAPLAVGGAMPARGGHTMVYEAGRQQVLVFGGMDSASHPRSDTWRLGPTGSWTQVPTQHAPLAQTAGAVMAYDISTNRTVLECLETRQGGVEVAATWTFDGVDWTRDVLSPRPPQRCGHALVPDALPGGMLLFGGYSGDFAELADTWRWDGERWIDRTPALSPPPRYEFQIATDRARSRVVLFGGLANNVALGDTWEWDGQSWTPMPRGAQDPSPRFSGAMAYDEARGVCVQFGGRDAVFLGDGGTRTWNGTTWQFITAVGPPPTICHAMAYDAARQEVLVFGGTTSSTPTGDLWRWNGSTWSHALPVVTPHPRLLAAMAYDPRRQRAIIHGGVDTPLDADTWEWDGVRWTQTWLARPQDMKPFAAPNAMAYDERRGCMLLHDGDELWTYTDQPGRALTYGVGCGVPAPLELRAPGRPFLGNEGFHLLLVGAPSPQPFAVFLGFEPDNTLLGAGCTAWLVPAQVWLAGVTNTFATLAHSPLPGDPALFGLRAGLQAAVCDLSSPLGFTVSNGLALVLGF